MFKSNFKPAYNVIAITECELYRYKDYFLKFWKVMCIILYNFNPLPQVFESVRYLLLPLHF